MNYSSLKGAHKVLPYEMNPTFILILEVFI